MSEYEATEVCETDPQCAEQLAKLCERRLKREIPRSKFIAGRNRIRRNAIRRFMRGS